MVSRFLVARIWIPGRVTSPGVLKPRSSALLLMLVLVAPGSLLHAEDNPPGAAQDPLLQRIAKEHQAITTIQGHATWKTRAAHEAPSEARIQDVRFFLQLPDRYNLTFVRKDDPDDKHTFICDGKEQCELQYFPGEAPEAKVSPIGQDHDTATFHRLIAAFRLDLPVLAKDFTIAAQGDASAAVLTLTPLRPEVADQLAKLVISLDAKSRVTGIDIEDAVGTHITIQVGDDTVYDQAIPAEQFRIPKGGAK